MPYSKTTWVNGTSPNIDATNLNNMEDGISKAAYGPDAGASFIPVGDGSGAWLYQRVTNAEIAVDAAISYSKLALSNSIVYTDLVGNIPASKIANYPSDGTKFLAGDGTWGSTSVTASSLAGYQLDYKQITSAVSIASTSESAGTTVITADATTFDGAAVYAEFFCPYTINSTTAGTTITIALFESTTELCRLAQVKNDSNGSQQLIPVMARYRFTPTAGSHTYKVTASATSTAGTPQIGAGAGGTTAAAPAYLAFFKA